MKDLQIIGRKIERWLNPKGTKGPRTGWCLLVYGFNAPGISNYLSNSNRADVIKALRETADVLERREDNPRPGTPEL